ncbi:nitrite reductase [Nocardioides nanhaiensis]|uniref:Nitrite/Sulfite reductase ferredoxin-like domain-containing protein n=1 Tax=Nocardioides nanhaiensis TaxID=1476871 RepID=A0ABP8WFA8_9ACTN
MPLADPTSALPTRPARTRRDRCPGVLRPWPADDGALVRVRLVGGRVTAAALQALSQVAQRHGDGDLHLTARANLQLRGLPLEGGALPEPVVAEVEATGLLPSRTHELARNVLCSPLTGLRGGRADLRPLLAELDRRLCADPVLAALPGRFCLVLDDGRGDLHAAPADLGLVALDDERAQVRVGRDGWGEVVALDDAVPALLGLARRFLADRGEGPTAAWHVDELPAPWAASGLPDPAALVVSAPLPHGGAHVAAPGGALAPVLVEQLAERGDRLVVTPWRGVVVEAEAAGPHGEVAA